jgi:branched-chain amino acid transport system permease protein
VYVFVFALGSLALTPLAVSTLLSSGAQSQIGHSLMIKTLAAIVIGGLGSLSGALAGGFLLGIVSNVALYWLPTSFGDATIYIILLLFITVRPRGIFGHLSVARQAG